MRISSARSLVSLYARNAGDTTFYPYLMKDAAIFAALEEFARRTKILRRVDSLDTVAGTDSYTTTTFPSRFRPDRILESPYLSGPNVTVDLGGRRYDAAQYVEGGFEGGATERQTTDLDLVPVANVRDRAAGTGQSGQPYIMGFSDFSSFQLFPNPDQVYTVNMPWNDFATPYAPTLGAPLLYPLLTGGTITSITVVDPGSSSAYSGTLTIGFSGGGGTGAAATIVATGGSLSAATATVTNAGTGYTSAPQMTILGDTVNDQTINIPEDMLLKALMFGGPAFLQHNEPEHAFATPSGLKFEQYIQELIGNAGGLGIHNMRCSPRRR